MKKIIISYILCLFSISGFAQQTEKLVKLTDSYTGKTPYISEATFKNATINGILELETVLKPNSINEVLKTLGDPKEMIHDKDKAIDGTVIFENKILIYSGLKFSYPLYDNFVISTIEFTSDNYYLCLGNRKLYVGMPIEDLKGLLPKDSSPKKEGIIGISVAKGGVTGKMDKAADGFVSLGFKNINIEYNSATGKVTKISITVRRI